MTRYLTITIVALAVSGCATLTKPGEPFYRPAQERKLAQAVRLLEEGKTSAAAELLTALAVEPAVAGVTDETLIRLSLLRISSGQEKNGTEQARHDLERLRKEFPASSWAPLASKLEELISAADDQRQQARKLRELNLGLTKENKELHQSIEKLKSLELELGKGSKH